MRGEAREDLEFEKNSSRKAKIGLAETIIFTLFSIVADIFELIPFIGLIVGIPISFAIILWTFLRGVHGRFAIKIAVARILSFVADAVLFGGFLPIRTIALIITIWLNNHLEEKNIKRVVEILEKMGFKA